MERTNLEALRAKCKLLCNTCYADDDALIDALCDNGIEPGNAAVPGDINLIKTAIFVVMGWVETSRSEGGISAAVDREAVEKNILFWCQRYGLDASEFLTDSMTVIQDGSNMY